MLAPYSNILIDKMYTHHTCVGVVTPPGSVPANRVLAIDGRNNANMCNADKKNYINAASGTLFWAISRTSDRAEANLQLAMTTVSAPEVNVQIPGLAKKKHSFTKNTFPQIPILVNKKAIPIHTKLLAMEDTVIVRHRNEEIKRKREDDDNKVLLANEQKRLKV